MATIFSSFILQELFLHSHESLTTCDAAYTGQGSPWSTFPGFMYPRTRSAPQLLMQDNARDAKLCQRFGKTSPGSAGEGCTCEPFIHKFTRQPGAEVITAACQEGNRLVRQGVATGSLPGAHHCLGAGAARTFTNMNIGVGLSVTNAMKGHMMTSHANPALSA